MIHGQRSGGDLYMAFWEIRSLLYVVVCFVLAANTVRTHQHLRLLVATGLIGLSLYAVEGAFRRLVLIEAGYLGAVQDVWYPHEAVVFFASLVPLIIAQQVFGGPAWQRVLGLMVLPVAMYATLASERRAGQVALMVGLLVLFLVFLVVRRKAFFLVALPVLLAGAVYMPLFWNASGLLAQPARAVRSVTDPDGRDSASNVYRDLEKVNVRETINASPLFGVGFGREFTFYVAMPDLSFWQFWRYTPHANILWIWLKTGAIGFVSFWALLGLALAYASRVVKEDTDQTIVTLAMFALIALVTTLTFSYVDLGFTAGRVNVFIGTLLGTLSVIPYIRLSKMYGHHGE